jgi:hypothetical protein
VQIRVSKAYISWKKGEIAVMQNWDNTRFTEYRKVAKPRLARGYGLQVVNGEIKMKLGIVNKADYEHLGVNQKYVIGEPTTVNGEDVFKLTDIIGAEPDLGVENLKGSGLIAGETSSAYEDIFTLTVVLGR